MKDILQIYLLCALFPLLITFQLHHRSWSLKIVQHRSLNMEIFEGNPLGRRVWDTVWKFPVMQPSEQGISPTTFGDAANVLKNNILQIYGNETSYDGAPVAVGEVEGLLEGSLFLGLKSYYEKVTSTTIVLSSLSS